MSDRWTRDEFLVTLDLYLNHDDVVADSSDEEVQRIAALIGRSSGAVAQRLANYRHLDPNASKGLENTGQPCVEIWREFHEDPDQLAREAKSARDRLSP